MIGGTAAQDPDDFAGMSQRLGRYQRGILDQFGGAAREQVFVGPPRRQRSLHARRGDIGVVEPDGGAIHLERTTFSSLGHQRFRFFTG